MSRDPLQVKSIHHVEIVAGNAKQSAYFYRKAFGFSQLAYAGLETGSPNLASYVLGQGRIRFVISTPLDSDHPHNRWLVAHGDGVADVALEVEDADAAFAEAVRRGATAARAPTTVEDEHGSVRWAAIRTWGDTVHSLVSRRDYRGPFLPGYAAREVAEPGCGLEIVDHVVGNVEDGQMEAHAAWYERVLGFHRYLTFDDKDISTEFTALRSVVMSSPNHRVKFPINEPAAGRKKSQIQEYVEFNHGPGVQHVALLTADIVATVRALTERGVEFLTVPDSYYDDLADRVGEIKEDTAVLRPLGILVDRDDKGYLLQLFTRPVEDRPTLFFEIIQRRGALGFGKGNFKALFESIEREQAVRGTL